MVLQNSVDQAVSKNGFNVYYVIFRSRGSGLYKNSNIFISAYNFYTVG